MEYRYDSHGVMFECKAETEVDWVCEIHEWILAEFPYLVRHIGVLSQQPTSGFPK